MPARTNDFQKLVKVINHHLAPAGAKVTESAMLYDAEAETEREIDILVESSVLNCDIKIGIECTASKRPLEVRQIESFKEKHRKVGISKTVIVAKYGFSDSAKNYALKNHIKLLTFNAAKSENWAKTFERLQNLSIYGRNYQLRSVSVVLPDDAGEIGFVFNEHASVIDQGKTITLNDFARNLFISSRISERAFSELKKNEESAKDPWIELGWKLDGKYEFRDQAGRVTKPVSIAIVMGYRSKYRSLDAKQVSYDGNDFVVGGFFGQGKGDFAHVAFNETDGKITGTLEVGDHFLPEASEPAAPP